MPTQKTSNTLFLLSINKVVVAALLVLIGVFLLLKFKIISSVVQAPDPSEGTQKAIVEKDIFNLDLWKPQFVQYLPFAFFLPEDWSVSANNPPGLFDILDEEAVERIQLATYAFDKLALQQKNLPSTEYEKFGWTNAYGMSVFEHRNFAEMDKKKLTAFVVNTHTQDVMEVTAEGDENIQVIQKALKTIQPNFSEDDKNVRVFVDFKRKYLFKYLPSYESTSIERLEIPTNGMTHWQILGDNEEVLGLLSVSTLPEDHFKNEVEKFSVLESLIEGKSIEPFEVIQTKKVGGRPAVIFQGEDTNFWPNLDQTYPLGRGMVILLDDEYVVIRYGWKEKKDLNAHAYEMSQLFQSVRMLTDQEKINK